MKVISGKYKGRKILVESKNDYRPTLTRIREDIFNLRVEKLKRISYGRFLLKSITYGEYKEVQVNESY